METFFMLSLDLLKTVSIDSSVSVSDFFLAQWILTTALGQWDRILLYAVLPPIKDLQARSVDIIVEPQTSRLQWHLVKGSWHISAVANSIHSSFKWKLYHLWSMAFKCKFTLHIHCFLMERLTYGLFVTCTVLWSMVF